MENQSEKQREESDEEEQQASPPGPRQQTLLSWESLINGTDPTGGLASSQPIIESHLTPKKEQKQQSSSDEKSKLRISSSTKKPIIYQTYQTTSSSSDSDSVVQHILHRPTKEPSPPPPKQPTPPIMPHALRQDSQATLIDENLDDLNSQLKQVLLDHERQTVNISTKEERAIDGFGSMSFPLSTPDVLSTDLLENDIVNRPKDDLLRRYSNQRTDYNQQRPRNPTNIPERSSPQRKKPHHHHHHHQKHSGSRYDGINSRKTDVNISI